MSAAGESTPALQDPWACSVRFMAEGDAQLEKTYLAGPPEKTPRTVRISSLFTAILLLLVGGVAGYFWHQQEWWPARGTEEDASTEEDANSECDEIQTLAEQAEADANTELETLFELVNESRALQRARIDLARRNELDDDLIPSTRSSTVNSFERWNSAVNLNRNCFSPTYLLDVEDTVRIMRDLG